MPAERLQPTFGLLLQGSLDEIGTSQTTQGPGSAINHEQTPRLGSHRRARLPAIRRTAPARVAVVPELVCRHRKVAMSRLIDPVVNLEFHQISNRGKKLPPGANEFAAFLRIYIARWTGRAGVL